LATVITKLSDKLKTKLNTADEIWVAAALLNSPGLTFIKDNLLKPCKQNFLIGLDLPSEPKALYKLYNEQLISDLKVKVYTYKEYYHPKLYLIREKNEYYAFVGSANCTIGGLHNNIELSIGIDDQKSCKIILEWFSFIFKKSNILTKPFIDKYALDYVVRKNKNKEDKKLASDEKKILIEEFEATLSEKAEFIKKLREYRKRSEYKKIKNERKEIVEELRESIDYPNFTTIEIDRFFSLYELGHIIAIPKPTIKREIFKFTNLLKMLCDENIDIAVRIDRALGGDLKIRGVGIGLVSKILVIHRPDLYFVKNDKTETALKKYGIELPRGLSIGTKYKVTNRFLRKICIETKIENFAILDYYLYIEGNKQ
jgi:HKD family nuclease